MFEHGFRTARWFRIPMLGLAVLVLIVGSVSSSFLGAVVAAAFLYALMWVVAFVLGAVIGLLPFHLLRNPFRSDRWKCECGFATSSRKEAHSHAGPGHQIAVVAS